MAVPGPGDDRPPEEWPPAVLACGELREQPDGDQQLGPGLVGIERGRIIEPDRRGHGVSMASSWALIDLVWLRLGQVRPLGPCWPERSGRKANGAVKLLEAGLADYGERFASRPRPRSQSG